ncbi:MAG: hypothetical protein K0S08_1523 [Gammaproteobacteria bacterium]|jgi:hypothetical protein|nr:hypothetical protein [Gammaproteobacteria bacterium]
MSSYTQLITNAITQLNAYQAKPAGFFEDALKGNNQEMARTVIKRLEEIQDIDRLAIILKNQLRAVKANRKAINSDAGFFSFKARKDELETTLEKLIQDIEAYQASRDRFLEIKEHLIAKLDEISAMSYPLAQGALRAKPLVQQQDRFNFDDEALAEAIKRNYVHDQYDQKAFTQHILPFLTYILQGEKEQLQKLLGPGVIDDIALQPRP